MKKGLCAIRRADTTNITVWRHCGGENRPRRHSALEVQVIEWSFWAQISSHHIFTKAKKEDSSFDESLVAEVGFVMLF